MKRTKQVSQKKLFIEELERPALAGIATTMAVGEEAGKWGWVTTLAYPPEEPIKTK